METAMSVIDGSPISDVNKKGDDLTQKAATIYNSWQAQANELVTLFPELADETRKHEEEFKKSVLTLRERLKNPVLRIAAIGTTSSGKSTLLNFLIGDYLLPTDVQEKSAGVVRVIHSTEKDIFIEDTAGRLWECGNIEVENCEDIRNVLDKVMDSYHQALFEGQQLEAPSVIVHYPTSVPDFLDLPENCTIELMDLPGLRYTGDTRNRQAIGRCHDALCLVTYGSHETDPIKQEMILDDVMEQIQTIGAPISRMLFVATRIDEFLLHAPESWPENERAFIEGRTRAIEEKIFERFPDQIDKTVHMSTISPLPALYTLKLCFPASRDEAWKGIKHSFLGLVEGGKNWDRKQGIDLEVDVTRAYRMWDENEWSLITEQLFETTRAQGFLDTLKNHIAQNFSSIVLPPTIEQFVEDAKTSCDWLASELEFAHNTVKKNLDDQRSLLQDTMNKVASINTFGINKLRDFLNEWMTLVFVRPGVNHEKLSALQKTLEEKYPEFMNSSLENDYDWAKIVESAYLRPFECVINTIVKNQPLPESLPEKPNLERACLSLRRYGYTGSKAGNGITMVSHDNRDAQKFTSMVEAYNKLERLCLKSAQKSMEASILFQTDHLLTTLNSLLESFIAYLDQEYEGKIPAELMKVTSITPNSLRKFTGSFNLDSPLRVDRHASLKTKVVERTIEKEIMANTGIGLIDTLMNIFYSFAGAPKQRVQVSANELQIALPPVRNLMSIAHKTYKTKSSELHKKMSNFVGGQMSLYIEDIEAYQRSRLESYRTKLDDIVQEKFLNHEEMEKKLLMIQNELGRVEEAIDELCKF